jgi:hypothetical protein
MAKKILAAEEKLNLSPEAEKAIREKYEILL